MDFTSRQIQSPNTSRFSSADNHNEPTVEPDKDSNKKKQSKPSTDGRNLWVRAWSVIFLLCLVALVVALLLSLSFGKRGQADKYVDTSAYQAVEVMPTAGKPVYYFGNITNLSDNYLVLSNAVTLTSEPSNRSATVAPLNCVSPNDSSQLVINRAQVVMWDNLAAGSPTVQAIQQQASGTCPSPTAGTSRLNQKTTENQSIKSKTSTPTGNSSSNQPSASQKLTTPPASTTNDTTSGATGSAPTTP